MKRILVLILLLGTFGFGSPAPAALATAAGGSANAAGGSANAAGGPANPVSGPANPVGGATDPATGLANLRALTPAMDCADVAGLSFPGVTLTSAAENAGNCEVRGTIAPANTIVVRLPLGGWTQRYVQTGCGGLCGNANINYGQADGCPVIEDGSVASATTDMGHQGQNDGSWAAGNPQAQIDFAYRGVHETAVTAKKIIAAFYGRAPRYSYFTGCSDGGREALMEAQRYPDDFDGIAAGAPANNMAVQNTFHHAWNVLANRDANGRAILLANRLPLIHAAVLAACDGLDGGESGGDSGSGSKDGVLTDPRQCHFDPYSLVCADRATCLTRAEAAVVRKLHDGAVTARGERLEVPVGHEWGSELLWTLFVPATPDGPSASENFALSYLRYLADPNDPRPDYQLSDLQFTASSFWQTVLPSSAYMSAMDPDLTGFRRSGGKLLLWHGWNDQHIAPRSTLAYWDALPDRERFARLYMFPGVAHCGGGGTFDVLTPVMAWTESGRTPSKIVSSDPAAGTSRAVYPLSAKAARGDYDWIGKPLYSHGYQTWPRAVGDKLVVGTGYPGGHAR